MFRKSIIPSLLIFSLYIIGSYIIVQINKYGQQEIWALVLAGLLALLNIIMTIFFIEKNLTKNKNDFIKGFLKSTMVRIAVLLAIFFTIMIKMSLNHFVFGVAFFILYFLFQMIEIYILHTKQQAGK